MFDIKPKGSMFSSNRFTTKKQPEKTQKKVEDKQEEIGALSTGAIARLMLNTIDAPREGGKKGKKPDGTDKIYEPAGQGFIWVIDNVSKIISDNDAEFLKKDASGSYVADEEKVSEIIKSYVSLYNTMIYYYILHSHEQKNIINSALKTP